MPHRIPTLAQNRRFPHLNRSRWTRLAGAALPTLLSVSLLAPSAHADNWTTATAGQITSAQAAKVGIGFTTPAAQLDVSANTSGREGFVVNQISNSTIARFRQNGTSKLIILNNGSVGIGPTAPTGALSVKNTTGLANVADFASTDGTTRLSLADNGNIGLNGTVAVTGNVTATGTISATGGLKVKTWSLEVPDYVFEASHEPMSLPEVERFVKQHKHLPEVPSAVEMKKDGMDLADMNLRLLKKVEELTLYVIEQDKQIKTLSSKLR